MSDISLKREADSWLRWMAVIGPIVTFIIGWGTGVMTAALLYRDHEKRIQKLEAFQGDQERAHMTIAEALATLKARVR